MHRVEYMAHRTLQRTTPVCDRSHCPQIDPSVCKQALVCDLTNTRGLNCPPTRIGDNTVFCYWDADHSTLTYQTLQVVGMRLTRSAMVPMRLVLVASATTK